MHVLFSVVLVLYFIAVIGYLTGNGFKQEKLKQIAFVLFIITAVAHVVYFIWRWWAKYDLLELSIFNAAPIRGAFEYSMAFALGIAIVVIVAKSKMPWITSVGMPATALLMAFAATRNMEIHDLQPALRSPWFFVHAGTGVVAYAAFAVAAVAGIKYLQMLKKNEDEESKIMIQIDRMSYRSIVFGMLFFTVTIISGSIWAADAWSRFWFWDPKELWSLITWIFYAIYLHQRLRKNWRGRRCAILAIVGVGLVLFTWIGVNNLLYGLHSY
jgi:cytochrome c-type biogenesis protein CcsB